jgi:hypothetical protein
MQLNLSFASALLDCNFCTKRLFESVYGGLHIGIDNGAAYRSILASGSVRLLLKPAFQPVEQSSYPE